jgi:hypothetical protein
MDLASGGLEIALHAPRLPDVVPRVSMGSPAQAAAGRLLDTRWFAERSRCMDPSSSPFISTEQAAFECGMSPDWVRRQIRMGRLCAIVWVTGDRRTYRIRVDDWLAFRSAHSGPANDPRFIDEANDANEDD